MDKYKTCRFCPDRSTDCRTNCTGWQYREKLKQDRYHQKELARSANVDSKRIAKFEYRKHLEEKSGRR